MNTCKETDCTREIFTKKSGLCSGHYYRERRNSPRTTPIEAFRNFPSYTKAHNAVRAVRGKASEYPCINCGEPAVHWALVSLAMAVQDTWTVNKGRWFSDNIYDYSPMCMVHHYDYDRRFGLTGA